MHLLKKLLQVTEVTIVSSNADKIHTYPPSNITKKKEKKKKKKKKKKKNNYDNATSNASQFTA